MQRRERILIAINHQEPDRVPMNLDQTSDEIRARILRYYGAADMNDLYRKTGIDAFSVWHEHAAVVPVYRGWRGEDASSTYGPWGKVRQYVDPMAGETLDSYRWPRIEEFDFSTWHPERQTSSEEIAGNSSAQGIILPTGTSL
jgi:hypothetical protein